jgi:predicted ABC-type exoprotein transport system permease subunit
MHQRVTVAILLLALSLSHSLGAHSEYDSSSEQDVVSRSTINNGVSVFFPPMNCFIFAVLCFGCETNLDWLIQVAMSFDSFMNFLEGTMTPFFV